MIMELVRELLFTAFTAVLFSFLLAKLVSYAMAGGGGGGGGSGSVSERREVVMEELQFGERKLNVEILKSEKRIGFVGEDSIVEKVDTVEEKLHQVPDVASTDEGIVAERSEVPEKSFEVQKDASEEEKHIEIGDSSIKEREEPKKDVIADEEAVTESSLLPEKSVEVTELQTDASEENKAEIGDDSIQEREESKNDVIAESVRKESKDVPISDEDDEWEGIERSELENAFEAAAKFVGSGAKDDHLSDMQMDLYALHKVATEGPCRESQPMALMLSARAKWNAWQKLGNMSPEEAMEQYLAILSDKVPGWMEDHPHSGDAKSQSHDVAKPDAMASERTCSSEQTNTPQSVPEQNSGSVGTDLTGSSGIETQAKE